MTENLILNKIIHLLFIFSIPLFFGLINPQKVDAAYDLHYEDKIPAEPNIGSYIYEDKEYLTQNQVDQINSINSQLVGGRNSQNITLVIVDHIPLHDDDLDSDAPLPVMSTEEEERSYIRTLADKFSNNDDDDGRNILLLSVKDCKILFQGSHSTMSYLTDYKFWKMKQGVNFGKVPADSKGQIKYTIKLMEHLEKEIDNYTVYENGSKTSSTFEDWHERFKIVTDIIKLFLGIIVFVFGIGLIFSASPLATLLFISSMIRPNRRR